MGTLPNDLTQRSIIINMQKHPSGAPALEKLNELDPKFKSRLANAKRLIEDWSTSCVLDDNPASPLSNRRADNWRPLLAIADNLRRETAARMAAVNLSQGLPDDDLKVVLLEDIRDVFNGKINPGQIITEPITDRVTTKQLLARLHGLESGMWANWTGVNGDGPPHWLTDHELGRMLRGFMIKAHTIYPLGSRGSRGPSSQGFYRKDFEGAWASYCSGNPPTHQHTEIGRDGGC
jgi:hypothetical protein